MSFQLYYPVNTLRNVALDNAPTELVYLTDVDFVPSIGIHEALQRYSRHMKRNSTVR